MIIQKNKRTETLLNAGVSRAFIEAIDRLKEWGDIQYQIQSPEGAYYYLPSIENDYTILKDCDITPICDGSNGDTFYVLLSTAETRKFVYFELEADEIYNDFGDSFQCLLAHLMIDLIGFDEEKSDEDIIQMASTLGLKKAKEIIGAVCKLDDTVDMNVWEKEVLPSIIDEVTSK